MEWRPSAIAAAVGGAWVRRPGGDAPLAGVSIDSRESLVGMLFIAIRGETHDGHDFAVPAARDGAPMLLVEREIDVHALPDHAAVLRVADTRAALMQLAARYRATFTNTTVIAVTGSTGKTTTRQLIHSALGAALPGVASPKSYNNDIGVPLSLLMVRPDHRYAVIEVGINAVGEMQPLADIARPDVAVITNIGESHLEGLHDVTTIAREKLLLASALSPDGLAILHADSPALREHARHVTNVIWFGETREAGVRLADRGMDGTGHWFALADGSRFRLGLAGRHNAVNALAAVATARALGVRDTDIDRGLQSARAVDMRMQAHDIAGIRIMNDAYNANPQSMLAGVEAFLELTPGAAKHVLVLGDMRELGDAGPKLHESAGRSIGEQITGLAHALVCCVGPLASAHLAAGLQAGAAHATVRGFSAMTPGVADEIVDALEPGDAVFIKGSRAMAMEQLVGAIERRSASNDTGDRRHKNGNSTSLTVHAASSPMPSDC